MRRIAAALFLIPLLHLAAYASDSTSLPLMSLEEVRPGMKGHGMTVFQGTQPERFEVEILGVLDGVPGPKQNIIIAMLSGPRVARTSVFQGMSGSPVFIDGKLVGAVAYAFPFSKEPLAGITPIKQMIDIFEPGNEPAAPAGNRVTFNMLSAAPADPGAGLPAAFSATVGPYAAANPAIAPYVGQTIAPIATPVTFAGVPQAVLDLFAADLKKAGFTPIAGVGGGARITPMAPKDDVKMTHGSSVSVQLVRGDFAIDAAGTVTYRDGDRIYAFGHPFLTSGSTAWPMAENRVITVVPSVSNSFKLASGERMVGTISQDRATGVFGRIGEQARMIPVRLTVRTSRNKVETYNFEVVSDSFLTPLLMKIAAFSAISATERQIGAQTIKMTGRIAVKGHPDISLDNAFSLPSNAALYAVTAMERPIALLLNSGFEAVDLRGVEVNITSEDIRSSGVLSRLWVDKTEVRPGDSIEIQAFARSHNGAEFVERIPLEIPADAPEGPLVIIVGDGTAINQTDLRAKAAADFMPKDLGQLIRAINTVKKNNRLYVKVLRSDNGAIVNNEEMPALPPSVLATLGSNRTSGGYTPLSVATLAENELPPTKFLITGQQSITITVVK